MNPFLIMLRLFPLIVCFIILFIPPLIAQTKVVGECAITYDIHQISNKGDTILLGHKQVYIKGNSCKTILKTPELTQTLIFNTQEDSAIVLKEIGLNKLLQYIKYAPLSNNNLIAAKKIDSVSMVLNYKCETIALNWSDGTKMEVVFTNEMIPSVTVYERAFKEIPGLVLSYTLFTKDEKRVQYIATKVDLNPITLNVFEVNKSLYQQIY